MYNYYQQQPNSTSPINSRPVMNYPPQFINNRLKGHAVSSYEEVKASKVLGHEMTHAAMFSYGVQLTYDQEELLADIISTYGKEIVMVTNKVFKKIKGNAFY